MAVRTITTRLAIDGETAFKQAMSGVNASLRELRSELTLSETQFKGQANTLEALKSKQDILSRTYDQQKEKIRALEQAVKDATEAYGAADTTTLRYQKDLNLAQAELLRMGEQLTDVNVLLGQAQDSVDHTAYSIDAFGNSTEQAGSAVGTLASALAAAGVAKTIDEITGAIIDCTKASTQFQSDITGVFKTVDGTERQLSEIREGIKEMTTEIPATTSAIASVAESAGQLGIARENILDFTRVMIDLDETTDLTAENGAKSLARFANITRMQAADYSRLGSVIVDLGNNFATSESEITAMGTRLAAAGTLAKMTQPDILALGAAMSSVGIEAEAGGTAMTQTLTAIEKAVTEGGEKLETFARIANMSAEDFSAAWKERSVAAVQAFIAGLGALDAQGESATLVLDELGLSGIRQSNMLKSLALASDQLTGAIDLANLAWIENSALTEEATKRYETTEAKMQMAANAANNLKIAIGDELAPALGGLAEAGATGFQWLSEVVAEHPGFVSGVTAMIGVIGLFTGGVTAYTVASKLAAAASTELAAAMNLIPGVAVVTAITGIVAALGTLALKAAEARAANEELLESLESNREAFDETIASVRNQGQRLMESVSALEALAAVENKSALEKETMLALVNSLNEAVPDLTLAYDAQTDSLNMTGDAIRRIAQAELDREERAAAVDRMKKLLEESADISGRLADEEERLVETEKELARVRAQIAIGDYSEKITEYELALDDAREQIALLTAALENNQAEQDDLLSKYGEVTPALEETSESFDDLTAATEELTTASNELAGSVDTLSSALKEQSENGSLSLETAQKLIDAGYSAAVAIDTETGSVTLNKTAYIDLATAKINDQIASLETRRQSLETEIRLRGEAEAASHAGSAYWDMAGAQAAVAAFTSGNTDALALQIASLKKIREELNNYTGASKTASRTSARAKTQAETDLAAYKELTAELDHQRALELISEHGYYEKIKEYRDRYLTDEGNAEEYRRVTEKIYKYDKALADQEAALWAEQTETLADELSDRVKGIEKQRQGMEQALSGYGDLFTVKNDQMSLENIQEQIDAINAYETAMTALRERGLSQDLLDEVLSMKVDEATDYGERLLAMSDSQWEQYNQLWDEKQLRAAQVAEQFYKDQLKELETEYDGKLSEALSGLKGTSFKSGEDTAQGLIDGIKSKEAALFEYLQGLTAEIEKTMAEAWKTIPSNAELAAQLNAAAMQEPPAVTAGDVSSAISAGVNGMQTAMENRPLFVQVQSVMNVDSKEFFTETLPVQRAVARANPEDVDDK